MQERTVKSGHHASFNAWQRMGKRLFMQKEQKPRKKEYLENKDCPREL